MAEPEFVSHELPDGFGSFPTKGTPEYMVPRLKIQYLQQFLIKKEKKSSIVIESCESQTDHIETLAISLRLKDAKLVYAFTSIMIHDTFCIWS